ncbi:hypothetical protein Cni_G18935 [Canna indica]|uniref:Uncharacterized protein n=1 Tax=Canna indica TaxID=4628 RepID=A0AAQ3KQM4_9LILI|nr:hypothetical protein Cni_G18935 [Canna indica]
MSRYPTAFPGHLRLLSGVYHQQLRWWFGDADATIGFHLCSLLLHGPVAPVGDPDDGELRLDKGVVGAVDIELFKFYFQPGRFRYLSQPLQYPCKSSILVLHNLLQSCNILPPPISSIYVRQNDIISSIIGHKPHQLIHSELCQSNILVNLACTKQRIPNYTIWLHWHLLDKTQCLGEQSCKTRQNKASPIVSFEHYIIEKGLRFRNLIERLACEDRVPALERGGDNLGCKKRVMVEAMRDEIGLDLEEMLWRSTCLLKEGNELDNDDSFISIGICYDYYLYMKQSNAKKESCFFPIPQAADCMLSYRNHLGGDSQVDAMLDKTICAMSGVFIGASGSTFTEDIIRLRRGWESSSRCDEYLCQGELPNYIAGNE